MEYKKDNKDELIESIVRLIRTYLNRHADELISSDSIVVNNYTFLNEKEGIIYRDILIRFETKKKPKKVNQPKKVGTQYV